MQTAGGTRLRAHSRADRAATARCAGLVALLAVAALGASQAGGALQVHPASAVYRGAVRFDAHAAEVTFRVVGSSVVDFQLDRLDVQFARLDSHGRFHACNDREQAHPCLDGHFTSDASARGIVVYQGRLRVRWSARAIGAPQPSRTR